MTYRATYTLPHARLGEMDGIVHALVDAFPEGRPCGWQHNSTASVFVEVDADSVPGAWAVGWRQFSAAWLVSHKRDRPWPPVDLRASLAPAHPEAVPGGVVDTQVESIGAIAEEGW